MTHTAMTWLHVVSMVLLCIRDSSSLFLPDSKELRQLLSRYEEEVSLDGTSNTGGNRTRRAIRWSDREEILQLHNKLRGGVYPTASNMEYMVGYGPLLQSPVSMFLTQFLALICKAKLFKCVSSKDVQTRLVIAF